MENLAAALMKKRRRAKSALLVHSHWRTFCTHPAFHPAETVWSIISYPKCLTEQGPAGEKPAIAKI